MKNNIKDAREKKRMTQAECADKLNITLRAWQTYEQGAREPRFETLCAIADMLNVTTDYLLGRETNEMKAVERLSVEFNLTALEKAILENYLALPVNIRSELAEFLRKAVLDVQNGNV